MRAFRVLEDGRVNWKTRVETQDASEDAPEMLGRWEAPRTLAGNKSNVSGALASSKPMQQGIKIISKDPSRANLEIYGHVANFPSFIFDEALLRRRWRGGGSFKKGGGGGVSRGRPRGSPGAAGRVGGVGGVGGGRGGWPDVNSSRPADDGRCVNVSPTTPCWPF